MADDHKEAKEVERLIGADYNYQFIECPTLNNIHVIKSKMGLLLTGPYKTA